MKSFYFLIFILMIGLTGCDSTSEENRKVITNETTQKTTKFGLVLHGGAGTITRDKMTPEKEAEYQAKMEEALKAGYEVLNTGGSAMDAVEACIIIMEDSPLFNAGKGAVFTHAERNELDASFMDGKTLNAGAVGGVSIVKNPITAARAVMDKSNHVMLSGTGADEFSILQGLDTVDNSYFYTERRFQSLQKVKNEDGGNSSILSESEYKYGTVGAAALDKDGNIAAGTSTGGMTNKRWGRIGDSPIIGAGTYANNNTCAISCTGHGEFFIRYAVAHDISALMNYKNLSIVEAAHEVVNVKLKEAGGSGGIIGIDAKGNVAMTFNSEGMYRGYIKDDGEAKTFIYKDE